MRADPRNADQPLSRRHFLELTTAAAGGAILSPPTSALASSQQLSMPADRERSRAAQVHSPGSMAGRTPHPSLIRSMLERALQVLTGERTTGAAWRSILEPDDVIGLKFNRSGQQILGTSEAVGAAIVTTLIEAGWSPAQLVCIEAPASLEAEYGTTPPAAGYRTNPSDFRSGRDQLARVVDQVSAIINIPFLKTHNIAGMTCALKNLSHGLVKHPARYHANGCAPYIADIVANTEIGKKLRLSIVDALRVVYAGGPEATAETTVNAETILAAADPVATDLIALAMLNDLRSRQQLSPVAQSAAELGYLTAAHENGLGIAVWHGVELVRVTL